MQEIVSYTEAKTLGLDKYFNGKNCINGHLSERYITSRGCIECVLMRTKEYRKNDPDKTRELVRAQYVRDREKIKLHRHNRYYENPEKGRTQSRNWRHKNAEKHKESLKKWRRSNPDIVRLHGNNRRCRLRNIEGSHTSIDIVDIIKKQKYRCAYCLKSIRSAYHVDHVQPISKGGTDFKSNLQICCPTCNMRKHAKDPINFAQELGLLI